MDAEQFNARYPVGTPVTAYPGVRPEDFPTMARRLDTRTRSAAWELGHGEPVVKVEGCAGGIALTHIDPRQQGEEKDIPVGTQPSGTASTARANHPATAHRLYAQPGQWGTVHTYPSSVGARDAARHIRDAIGSFRVYGPPGSYETRTRPAEDGDGVLVEARYTGRTTSTPPRTNSHTPLSPDTERVLGQIQRGEIRCGPDAARAIAARHEEAYGHAWPRPTTPPNTADADADACWAEALAGYRTPSTA
ncbi:hypothetical protein [Streptomyces sp. NPDC002845]